MNQRIVIPRRAIAAARIGGIWANYGGTANAITLVTGGGLVPVTGLQVRFRATAANTGATTISLNGGADGACRTVTGVALPADYIRTTVDTVATFDGTFWVLSRAAERGSGFIRWENGQMMCRVRHVIDQSIAAGGTESGTWTFPAAFSATGSYSLATSVKSGATDAGTRSAASGLRAAATSSSATQAIWAVHNNSAGAMTARLDIIAEGTWYQ